MTPKEKAEELMSQMENDFQYFASKEIAKRHALIAVDEILKQYKKIIVSHKISAYISAKEFNTNLTNIQNQLDHYVVSNSSYWMQVKQEIQSL